MKSSGNVDLQLMICMELEGVRNFGWVMDAILFADGIAYALH
jgi:hypothetical protein